LRFLVRFGSHGERGQKLLAEVRSLARAVGLDPRNPKWTSAGSLELDVFAPTEADFLLFLAAVEPVAAIEFWRDLGIPPKHMEKEEIVAEARSYFNDERYWECHETLEALWRTLSGDEKLFVQGVILVCAAFVHHQKAEDGVAVGVLRRALPQLEWGEEFYGGIDVPSLRSSVRRILRSKSFGPFRI